MIMVNLYIFRLDGGAFRRDLEFWFLVFAEFWVGRFGGVAELGREGVFEGVLGDLFARELHFAELLEAELEVVPLWVVLEARARDERRAVHFREEEARVEERGVERLLYVFAREVVVLH